MRSPIPVLAIAAIAACAPPAFAHDRQFAIESQVLGRAHALEHERERAAIRALPARAAAPVREPDPEPPAEVGAWDVAPFDLPDYGIHAALLGTGRVLLYGYPRTNRYGTGPNNHGNAWIWDPAKGTGHDAFHEVPPPEVTIDGADRPAPIFCSGLSFLPNGDLIVTGGNLDLAATAGIASILTFDPYSERWHRQGEMGHGRWYPSQVLTPDGRVVILGGLDESGTGKLNPQLEIWPAPDIPVPRDPSAEGIPAAHLPSGDRLTALYPHLFTMRDGRIALVGPAVGDTGLLDPATWTWSALPPLPGAQERIGGNAIPLPGGPDGPGRIELVGGYDRIPPATEYPATASTAALTPGGGWEATPPQSVGRAYGNTVLLPDATMVTVGGGAGVLKDPDQSYWTDDDDRFRHVELWDPATGSWRVGPAQQEFRTYHSVALLLPDGTVLSAGDDYHEDEANGSTAEPWIGNAEIYRPPYLFRGPRPVIESAPATVLPGERFAVAADDDVDVERAVLMAPSAVTHGADMSQRHVELQVAATTDDGLELVAPPSYAAAPPGEYMLFLLSGDGVPSVARFVRFGLGGDDAPVAAGAGPPGASAPRGRAGLVAGSAPDVTVSVPRTSRRAVRRSARLSVRLRASAPVILELHSSLTRVRRVRTVAGARSFSLALSPAGRRALRRASRRVDVTVRARILEGSGWVVKRAKALLR